MSGDLVLDTSVVIAVLRGVPGVEDRLEQSERLWLPLIALGELELGVELASNPGAQRAGLNPVAPEVPTRHRLLLRLWRRSSGPGGVAGAQQRREFQAGQRSHGEAEGGCSGAGSAGGQQTLLRLVREV